jgi:Fucose-binding lectin II (PA-IIL)
MANIMKYGDTITLCNAFQSFSGWNMSLAYYLNGKHIPPEQAHPVVIARSTEFWKIEPAAGSAKQVGDPIINGDPINLRMLDLSGVARTAISLHSNDNSISGWFALPLGQSPEEKFTITAVTAITGNGQISGTPIEGPLEYGSGTFISFGEPPEYPHSIVLIPDSNAQPEVPYELRHSPTLDITSWWRANLLPGVDPEPTGTTDGVCNLPANTHFTVSGIGNSSEMHTVVIDIEGMPEDQAHPGFHVGPVGVFGTVNMVWTKTGSGKVTVSVGVVKDGDLEQVTKIDNPLKLLGKHVAMPNGTNLFIVAANDGVEPDRNDCLVTITWPIENSIA